MARNVKGSDARMRIATLNEFGLANTIFAFQYLGGDS